ncbi:hypothetical protein [Caballeronia sp. LZ034LL]|uniref:hypothetical protein n=1 Tax=Caballeronia sp. LZ034LL TaxID=3038567 RepID=UPI00285C8B42|nr:hypothetical protein [Caballeronia sp. LZ034LL]MDR5839317.1 hypothetical protein [Caballeronia sp. LZ034LL]
MSYGIETDALQLYQALSADSDVEIPDLDLSGPEYQIPGGTDSDAYKPVTRLTNEDLTSGAIDGAGTFDVMMQGMKAQLREEFDKGRITGAEYTKAYISLTQSTMQFAVQYLLGRDQAYWQSVTAQAQAITARIANETAKLQAATVKLEAENAKATVALTKAKIATEDVNYGQGKYQIDNILPVQLATANAQLTNLGAQLLVIQKQQFLYAEQGEAARAQTLDVRSDFAAVAGSVGKQKDLYAQQITSYQRDAEIKFVKMLGDSWITQKTVDDGLTAPNSFTNANIDTAYSKVQYNLQLSA